MAKKDDLVEAFEGSIEARRRRAKIQDFGLPREIAEAQERQDQEMELRRRIDSGESGIGKRRDPMKRDFE